MKHIAVINYGDSQMALGLGETEEEAANNAVEAYGGAEFYLGTERRRRPDIDIFDLVDGMRLDYGRHDVPYRVYKGPIGGADPAGPRP